MANTRVYIVPDSTGTQRSAYPSGNWTNVNAPTGLSATVDGRTIVFQLTDTNSGAAAYVIQRSETSNGTYTDFATGSAGATTITTTGNQPGTFYYRAVGVISSVRSTASGVVSATVAAPSVIGDGELITVTVPGAGSNVAPEYQEFIGGVNSPINSATLGVNFSSVAPSGWYTGGDGPIVSDYMPGLNGARVLRNDRANSKFQFAHLYDTGAFRRSMVLRASYFFIDPNGSGFPTDTAEPGQIKLMRFAGDRTGSGGGYSDWDGANLYMTSGSSSVPGYVPVNPSGTTLYRDASIGSTSTPNIWRQIGEWITVEFRCIDSSAENVADGSVRLVAYRESTGQQFVLWARNNCITRTIGPGGLRYGVFHGYMGNGLDTMCQLFWDRDCYISWSDTTTLPKMVIIGDAATWSQCTVRTVCEWTSWVNNGATSNITLRANKGRHDDLSGKYVYILSDVGAPINSSGVLLQ